MIFYNQKSEKIVKPKDKKIYKRIGVYGVCLMGSSVLLIKSKHSGKWEIPGGKREACETNIAALKREFEYETGYEIKRIGKKINEKTQQFYAGDEDRYYNSKMFFYLVDVDYKKPINNNIHKLEVERVSFLPLSYINKKHIKDNHCEILENIKEKNENRNRKINY